MSVTRGGRAVAIIPSERGGWLSHDAVVDQLKFIILSWMRSSQQSRYRLPLVP